MSLGRRPCTTVSPQPFQQGISHLVAIGVVRSLGTGNGGSRGDGFCEGNSGIQLDGCDHSRDRSARTRLIRLEPAVHRREQSDQLPQHHIQHRPIVVGKIRGTIQRQTVVDQRRHVVDSARCNHRPHSPQTLAINLPQQIQFISAPPRLARQESHKQRLSVDARQRPVTQSRAAFPPAWSLSRR